MTILPDYLKPIVNENGSSTIHIKNNGFFPTVFLNDQGNHERDKCKEKLLHAVLETNDELEERVCYWTKRSYYTLNDVPQDTLQDEQGTEWGILVLAYHQAVHAKFKEKLNRKYRDTDTTEYAVPKAKALDEVAFEYEMEYRRAIYKLMGRGGESITCELL